MPLPKSNVLGDTVYPTAGQKRDVDTVVTACAILMRVGSLFPLFVDEAVSCLCEKLEQSFHNFGQTGFHDVAYFC